jgi:hypothetical protein
MNAGRDVERSIAQWLVEESPGRAPDRVLAAARDVIDRTKQRRFAVAWREPVSISMRGLAFAAALVVVAVVGAGVIGRSTAPVENQGAIPPVQTPSPSAAAVASPAPIAEGSYLGPTLQVADIVAAVNGDTKLSQADRTYLINDVMGIGGAQTIALRLDLHAGQWVQSGIVDGKAAEVGSRATYSFPDDRTIVLREQNGTQEVGFSGWTITPVPNGFRLTHIDPPANEQDALVIRLLFEAGPYTKS